MSLISEVNLFHFRCVRKVVIFYANKFTFVEFVSASFETLIL